MLLDYERYYGLGMDALVTHICSWNTNVITRVIKGGHGYSDDRVLLEHERYSGVGMDALMTVCSRNTNIIEVWARMLK